MDTPSGRAAARRRTGRLFPTQLEGAAWHQFPATGFSAPACGAVFHGHNRVADGMPLGGLDTGCLDLATSGLLGYCSLFNTHTPRRGPLNLPLLALSTRGKTWVLCQKRVREGLGEYQHVVPTGSYRRWTAEGYQAFQEPFRPGVEALPLEGVQTASDVHYWGHYPVADLEFDTSAPIAVGLRAWSPFLPGDLRASTTPAIVLEVHLRRISGAAGKATVAISFPGPLPEEAGVEGLSRQEVSGPDFRGVEIAGELASCCVGVIGEESTRLGGGLGAAGSRWAKVARGLPGLDEGEPGAAAAVDLTLGSGGTRVVRFVISWCAPTWNAGGHNGAGAPHSFTHGYTRWHPDAAETARRMAVEHGDLLRRVLAWQQEVYTEGDLPVWLRDSLVNNLHLLAECSFWAQKGEPLPDWVREEDGLFGLSECPRGCPQIECIPCSFYGNQPVVYFFPELALSTLRGYRGYQYPDGAPSWIFGGCTGGTPPADFANPTRGYQWTSNGVCIAAMVDRYLLRSSPGEAERAIAELYPMVKQCMLWTLGLRTTPGYTEGERIIAMPDPERREGLGAPREWFEADAPGFFGLTAHAGGLHLAQLRLTGRLARRAGDEAFAEQCATWATAGLQAMEERLWTGSHYLNCLDPLTGERSDLIFGYQLDGEWIADHHGLGPLLPEERVRATLETLRRTNVAATRYGGAVCYTNPDGSPRGQAETGVWDYGTYASFQPPDLMLAMTYMYAGEVKFGLELAQRVWHNVVCRQGCAWQMPNGTRGDADTGQGRMENQYSDYYQNMMLWSLPAAIAGQPFDGPARPGGLVDRILEAAAPAAAASEVVSPEAAEPATAEPAAAQSAITEPEAAEPAGAEPAAVEPAAAEPATSEAAATEATEPEAATPEATEPDAAAPGPAATDSPEDDL